jgi:anti-anti-sigma factor
MQVTTTDKGTYVLLSVSGRLDASSSPAFNEAVAALGSPPAKHVLVDLGGMEYVSSSGLRSLLTLAKSLHKAGLKSAFCSLQTLPEEIFRVAGFMSILTISPNEASAAAAL